MKKEAMLYEKYKGGLLHCFLCSHHCKIADDKLGICGVRQNIGGILYTHVYGEVIAARVDPMEKKPLYHFLPGSRSFSIATIGCNFRCGFCQNWQISQKTSKDDVSGTALTPENVVAEAIRSDCRSIAYTYTEPTIFFEYAYDIARLAKDKKLANIFVTNGFMTREMIETARPWLDAANIDLKSFRDEFYKKTCHGKLAPVLDSIRLMKKLNIWVEVTTLLIPGENDSKEELNDIAKFLAETSDEIPWHVSRFHPDYKFTDQPATPHETLVMARDIGKRHGLKYIYLGNVSDGSDTCCPNCRTLLVKRQYFEVLENNITPKNTCPACNTTIPGRWK